MGRNFRTAGNKRAAGSRRSRDVSNGGLVVRFRPSRLLLLTTLMSTSAYAQEVPSPVVSDAPSTAPQGGGDIVVTGSRLRSRDATSISPISEVSGDQVLARGSVRVEDMVNTLPQAFADQGGNNRASGGVATINLRKLGNQRTLVLLNGRRLMPGDPDRAAAQAPDINNIPTALIDRVEVVTGGASAVYGSDAIAGVVNFTLKRNFEGIQLDAQYGLFLHNNDNPIARVTRAFGQVPPQGNVADGGQVSLAATVGTNFADGRGNITAYAQYRHLNEVRTADRDYTFCNLRAVAGDYACGTTPTSSPAQFQLFNPTTGLLRDTVTVTSGRTFRTYLPSDNVNAAPFNSLQTPTKRINLGALANFKFSQAFELYGEFGYMSDTANVRTTTAATFFTRFNINCNNPLLSAAQVTTLCTSVGLLPTNNAMIALGFRNTTGDSVIDVIKHTSYRGVIGVRGDIGSDWRYDLYAQYGRTDYRSLHLNDFSQARIQDALFAIAGANGPVCRSGNAGCQPLDIFAPNSVSDAARNYIEASASQTGFTRERVFSGSLTGSIGITSPLAVNAVNVAIGAEYRDEALGLNPDAVWRSGDLTTAGIPKLPISGSFSVKEVFGEIRIPLIERKPFFESLAFEGGARYSDYSNSGGVATYKLGGDWAPVAGLRFRGGYQRAVRAPNVTELFAQQRRAFFVTVDPCEGPTPSATAQQCARTGLSTALYGTLPLAGGTGLGTLIGGNPNLTPETSNSITFGAQFNPQALRRLNITIDYFDIKVKKLISTIPVGLTLSQCVATGDPYFCSLIHRDPVTGSLTSAANAYIDNINLNTGSLQTRGIDVALRYRQPLQGLLGSGGGDLEFNFAGTYTASFRTQTLPTSTSSYDCVGYFGLTCGLPTPDWRHRLVVTWTGPSQFVVSGTWRYIGGTKNDRSSGNPLLAGAFQAYDGKIPTVSYFDLGASVTIDKKLTLRLGVNNLFDRDPPLTASVSGPANNGTFFSGMYDALGRYAFVAASVRF